MSRSLKCAVYLAICGCRLRNKINRGLRPRETDDRSVSFIALQFRKETMSLFFSPFLFFSFFLFFFFNGEHGD